MYWAERDPPWPQETENSVCVCVCVCGVCVCVCVLCVCVCVLRERKWDSQPYSVLWKESMNTKSMGVSFFPRLGESEVSLKDVLEMLASPNISDIVTPKHEI